MCSDYLLEIESKLGIPTMGKVEHFPEIFEYLMKLSIERQTRFMSVRQFTPTVLKDIINRDYETFS